MTRVEVTLADRMGLVQLQRPEKLNAMTAAMWSELAAAVERLSTNDDVRVVVLRGAGGRSFSVGADIGEFESTRATKAQAIQYAAIVHEAVAAIAGCRHPTIAAIDGLCVGGGVELAAACDLRIASASSRFGIPIKRLGLTVDYPELQGLIRLVGTANALELVLEGRIIGSTEAAAKGLVNRVVKESEFDAEIAATVERIRSGAPLVARWHKRMAARLDRPEPVTSAEREEVLSVFDSEDYAIGTRAFLDKTEPKFVGR